MSSGSHARLFSDIVHDRMLTGVVLTFNGEWMMDYCGMAQSDKARPIPDELVMTMGGFYELMFRRLNEGAAPDIQALVKKVLLDTMVAFGCSKAEQEKFRQKPAFEPKQLSELTSAVLKSLQ